MPNITPLNPFPTRPNLRSSPLNILHTNSACTMLGDDMFPDENESFTSAASILDEVFDSGPDDLRHVFETFDANGDGRLSMEELSKSLENLGLPVAQNDLASMIHVADLNGDGFVDFPEFVNLFHSLSVGNSPNVSDKGDTDLKAAFEVFDKNGDGFISAQELQSVLSSLGFKQGKKLIDCQNMIRGVDSDGDGMVNFAEFRRMMIDGFCDA